MNLDDPPVNGTPLRDIRKVFRKHLELNSGVARRFDSAMIREVLQLSGSQADLLIESLRKEGYITDDGSSLTTRGHAIAVANDLPRISQEQACVFFEEFLRALDKHNDPSADVFIEQAFLFGSYMSPEKHKDFGDIDILLDIGSNIDDDDDSSLYDTNPLNDLNELTSSIMISPYISLHHRCGMPRPMPPTRSIYVAPSDHTSDEQPTRKEGEQNGCSKEAQRSLVVQSLQQLDPSVLP